MVYLQYITNSHFYFLNSFNKTLIEAKKINYLSFKKKFQAETVLNVITSITPLGIFLLGGILIVKNSLTLGGLIAVYSLSLKLYSPINRIVILITSYKQTKGSLERAIELIEWKPKLQFDINYKLFENHKTLNDIEIKFKNVNFHYLKNKCVLNNVDFEIKQGELVCLCGENGTGKTTIAKLILRLVEPSRSIILINGKKYKEISINLLREKISYVPQQIYLFNCSIKDNILLGKNELFKDLENNSIIKLLNLNSLVSRLNARWDTIVGDGGLALSGGEKQKIGIARALIKNPSLIIWDEPLTYLDNESKKNLFDIINFLKENNKTQLIITHDKSLFSITDKIFNLTKNGILYERCKTTLNF